MDIKVHLCCLLSIVTQIKCLLRVWEKTETHVPPETMAMSYKCTYTNDAISPMLVQVVYISHIHHFAGGI